MATEMSESHSAAHVIGATGGAIPTMAAADSNKVPLENSDFSNSPLDKRLLSKGRLLFEVLLTLIFSIYYEINIYLVFFRQAPRTAFQVFAPLRSVPHPSHQPASLQKGTVPTIEKGEWQFGLVQVFVSGHVR